MKKSLLSLAAALGLMTAPVHAAVVVNIFDDGNDLVVDFSGSINTSGLTLTGGGSATNFASLGTNITGVPFPAGSFSARDEFTNFFNAPAPSSAPFFSGDSTSDGLHFTRTGDTFGFSVLYGVQMSVLLGVSYQSGAALSGSARFTGVSIASQTLINGTYVLDLPSDTITLNIGDAPAPVPLPASALRLFGGLGGMLCLRHLKPSLA